MVRPIRLISYLVALPLWFAAAQEATPARASNPGEPSVAENQGSHPPTKEELEAERSAVADNADLAGAVKPVIEEKYREAIGQLESAASYQEQEKQYRDALNTAPQQTRKFLEELQQAAPERPRMPKDLKALDEALTAALTEYATASEEFAGVQERLSSSDEMSAQASKRLPAAREELTQLDQKLAATGTRETSSPGRSADRALLLARRAALSAEVSMIEMERLSHTVRMAELDARSEVLERRTQELAQWIASLQDQRSRLMESESRGLVQQAGKIWQETEGASPQARALAAEIVALAREYTSVAGETSLFSERRRDAERALERVRTSSNHIREQFELGGLQGSYVQLLQRQRGMMADPRAYLGTIERHREALAEARLGAFAVREQLQLMALDKERPKPDSSGTIDHLAETKRAMLRKLEERYRDLVRGIVALVAIEQEVHSTDEKARTFLREKLFWVKGSPALRLDTFKSLPASVKWFFAREHWSELGAGLVNLPGQHPLLFGLITAALLAQVLFWKRLIRALEDTCDSTRRITTDRYRYTIKALVITVVLALPVPLAVSSVALALLHDPDASEWLRGVALGLQSTAFAAYALLFLAASSRPRGLSECHFAWNSAMLQRIRRASLAILTVFLSANPVIGSTFFDSPEHFECLGRIAYIVAELVLAGIVYRAFHPEDGIFAHVTPRAPGGRPSAWHLIAFRLLVGLPVALALMAALGYLLTTITLSGTFRSTVCVVAAGFFAYALILRWFLIRGRKLALAEAIERRRQRQRETAEAEETPRATDQFEVEEAEAHLDIESIGGQTRRLVRLVVISAVVVGLYYIWTIQLAALRVFDHVNLTSHLTLGDVLRALLIGIATSAAARNLPGLLEVSVLRPLEIGTGTRKAVSSLCQYAVVLIGVAVALQYLNVDWSKFGWIAAALSVGIGFGLQEVVANFICGIILLFERPIRVGDTVTVQDIEGVVTRIQMRATTITNWDRKDFIVPNKELVTGTMMNWTLTSPITRVNIPVGVAYGTDTAVARAILQEIAEAHPAVLKDPAPFTAFQDFADSALLLELRIYLGDISRRVSTYTEIRETIAQRYAEAGIEIAFPQRDLNIRSVSPEAREAFGLGGGNGRDPKSLPKTASHPSQEIPAAPAGH